MKKSILSLLILSSSYLMAQSTATNFTANDCKGNSHTLFNELDAGKVIVISFAMPCNSCIGPTKIAYAEVQSFASSHPGRVFMYIVDDYGNDPCATIDAWADANAMPNSVRFSNNTIKMSDYGTDGMPKVLVLGGSTHEVFYNANNTVNGEAINVSIEVALDATSNITKHTDAIGQYKLAPSPAKGTSNLSFYLKTSSDIKIELYNSVGAHVRTVFSGKENAGVHAYNIDCADLANGLYFVKINSAFDKRTLMLSVAN